jgi:hypothetical protein
MWISLCSCYCQQAGRSMDGFVSYHSFLLHVCLLSHHHISVSICKFNSISITTSKNSILKNWSRGNALDSYSGDAQVKSWLGHWLSWGFSWVFWIPPTKCQDSTLIRRQLLPCISFLMYPTFQWYITSVLKALLITCYKIKEKLVGSSMICCP